MNHSVREKGSELRKEICLNLMGYDDLKEKVHCAFACLFADRAISYRTDPGFEHEMVQLCACQKMARSKTGSASVMLFLDTESGFRDVVFGTSAYGLGEMVKMGDPATVSCTEDDAGYFGEHPDVGLEIMLKVGNFATAVSFGQLPNLGVSFTRLEFSITNAIGLRPMALLNYDTLDAEKKALADHRMWRYSSPKVLYINQVAEGVASLDASVYSKRISMRLSDFKTNGYKSLVVGEQYEPDEENSMFGFRCCSRYADQFFEECFGMEGEMDMRNVGS